jgi:hypothetical protein
MPIISFGRSRESTTWISENYKAAVRLYWESLGYAATTDSFVEGHPADMIFEPTWPGSKRRIWVETKDQGVSLSDNDFRNQIMGYLAAWLALSKAERPEMKVFVRKAKNHERWNAIFGPSLDTEEVVRWLSAAEDLEGHQNLKSALDEDRQSILDFFSQCQIFEGEKERIEDASKEKESTATYGMTRYADLRRKELERRDSVDQKSDILITNLVPIALPKYLVVVETSVKSIEETREKLRGRYTPPYVPFGHGRILTLDTDQLDEVFESLGQITTLKYESKEIEELYQNPLFDLLDQCVDSVLYYRGFKRVIKGDKTVYIIPPKRDTSGLVERTLPSQSQRTFTVTTPMFKDLTDEEGLAARQLNYVFHRGLVPHVVLLWGKYYVSIRLKRVFTSDGETPLDSDSTKRLDAHYRNPLYSRSSSQLSTMSGFAHYVFHEKHWERRRPDWLDQIRFEPLLETRTNWSPVSVLSNVPPLEEFDGESEGGESSDEG